MFLDDKFRKQIKGRDYDKLSALKLKNGEMIHVGNQDTQFVMPEKEEPQV